MSFTIEIPDALADQLRAEAEARGEDLNHYAVAKLGKPADEDTDDIADTDDPEVIAALQDVIDDYNRGERGRPVEEFMAELDAKYGPVPTSSRNK